MRYQDSVFNQLLKGLPKRHLKALIDQHSGDYRVRTLGCYEQFIALLYAQLTGRKSLRDLALNFNAHKEQFYHLGVRGEIKRSTLADANNTRPVAIFRALFDWFVQDGLSRKEKREAKRIVSLFDSSTVILNKEVFAWALGHKNTSGIKLHTIYDLHHEIPTYFELSTARASDLTTAKPWDIESGRTYVFDRGYYGYKYWKRFEDSGAYFITRLKKHSPTREISVRESSAETILLDRDVLLSERLSHSRKNPYNTPLREITVKVDYDKENIRIVTNDRKASAQEIVDLYKKRWQIELFFKWIKQNLKIKRFLGTSKNAVEIQLLVAMIAYILTKQIQRSVSTFFSISMLTLTRLFQMNLMRRIDLFELVGVVKPPPENTEHFDQGELFNA